MTVKPLALVFVGSKCELSARQLFSILPLISLSHTRTCVYIYTHIYTRAYTEFHRATFNNPHSTSRSFSLWKKSHESFWPWQVKNFRFTFFSVLIFEFFLLFHFISFHAIVLFEIRRRWSFMFLLCAVCIDCFAFWADVCFSWLIGGVFEFMKFEIEMGAWWRNLLHFYYLVESNLCEQLVLLVDQIISCEF